MLQYLLWCKPSHCCLSLNNLDPRDKHGGMVVLLLSPRTRPSPHGLCAIGLLKLTRPITRSDSTWRLTPQMFGSLASVPCTHYSAYYTRGCSISDCIVTLASIRINLTPSLVPPTYMGYFKKWTSFFVSELG